MTISWPIRGELLVYKTLEEGVEEESFLSGILRPSFFLKGSDNIRNRGLIPFRVVVIVDGLVVVVAISLGKILLIHG